MQIGTKVRLSDDIEALTDWNNGPVDHFMGRVGVVTKESFGILRVYFPPCEGGQRGAERPFPPALLVTVTDPAPEPTQLTLEERVEQLEAAIQRIIDGR